MLLKILLLFNSVWGNTKRFELHSFHFFLWSRTQFLLVRLAFLAFSTGIWYRFNNHLHPIYQSSVFNQDGNAVWFSIQWEEVAYSWFYGVSLAKKPYFNNWFETFQNTRKTSGHGSGSSCNCMKKRAVGPALLVSIFLDLHCSIGKKWPNDTLI